MRCAYFNALFGATLILSLLGACAPQTKLLGNPQAPYPPTTAPQRQTSPYLGEDEPLD